MEVKSICFFKELIFEQKICKNILSIQRRLQFHIIGLFLSSGKLISPHLLFPLIFKFPCTMGENIRIFHIEIIYLIGGNITAVIVIILTKSTFELLDQLIPEIRTYLDSGVQQFCILFRFRTKFFFPESGGIFFKLFFERDVLRIQDIKIVIHLVVFLG